MTNERDAAVLRQQFIRDCTGHLSSPTQIERFTQALDALIRAAQAALIKVGETTAYEVAIRHSGDVQLGTRFILEAQREAIRRGGGLT